MTDTPEHVAARRAELALEADWLDVQEAFLAAKAARDGSPEADAAYQAAKRAMSEMRTYWRQIGEATGVRRPAGMIATTTDVAAGEED